MVLSNAIVSLRSRNTEDTIQIGRRLGEIVKPGDIIALYGDLGTGKTVLTKGIAQVFQLDERDIVSASFTMVAEYRTQPPFIHIDLYRIRGDGDVEGIGLWEYFRRNDTVTVVEWAERGSTELPDSAIKVRVGFVNETEREILIEGLHEEDRHYLQAWDA